MSEKASILLTWGVLFVICYVINALAYRKEFKKAGASEGLAFVPFLREVQMYKLSWNKKNIGLFWIVSCLLGLVLLFVGSMIEVQILAWVGFVLVIISQVLQILRTFKQSKAFGSGSLATLLLVFLNPIGNIVVARSTSEYKGAM